MLSDGQFKKLTAEINVPDSGFTVNPKTGRSPRTGAMVSVDYTENQIAAPTTEGKLKEDFTSRSFKKDEYWGGWHDPDEGEISLDNSRRIMSSRSVKDKYGPEVARADRMTTALDLGIAYRQKSVFDLDTFKTTDTGYDPTERRKAD